MIPLTVHTTLQGTRAHATSYVVQCKTLLAAASAVLCACCAGKGGEGSPQKRTLTWPYPSQHGDSMQQMVVV